MYRRSIGPIRSLKYNARVTLRSIIRRPMARISGLRTWTSLVIVGVPIEVSRSTASDGNWVTDRMASTAWDAMLVTRNRSTGRASTTLTNAYTLRTWFGSLEGKMRRSTFLGVVTWFRYPVISSMKLSRMRSKEFTAVMAWAKAFSSSDAA